MNIINSGIFDTSFFEKSSTRVAGQRHDRRQIREQNALHRQLERANIQPVSGFQSATRRVSKRSTRNWSDS
jgi:hypothetical protein